MGPVLFFDGFCILCDGIVNFLMKRTAVLKFSSLQGELAKGALPSELCEGLETVVFLHNGKILVKTECVIAVLFLMSWPYQLLAWFFRLVPLFIADRVYDHVAANRYRWFGKRQACRLPTPAERERLLP